MSTMKGFVRRLWFTHGGWYHNREPSDPVILLALVWPHLCVTASSSSDVRIKLNKTSFVRTFGRTYHGTTLYPSRNATGLACDRRENRPILIQSQTTLLLLLPSCVTCTAHKMLTHKHATPLHFWNPYMYGRFNVCRKACLSVTN